MLCALAAAPALPRKLNRGRCSRRVTPVIQRITRTGSILPIRTGPILPIRIRPIHPIGLTIRLGGRHFGDRHTGDRASESARDSYSAVIVGSITTASTMVAVSITAVITARFGKPPSHKQAISPLGERGAPARLN